jgi:hypothetical protein
MGIALETVSGTYAAPTKFVPFETEGLKYQQDTQYRRAIQNSPDVTDAVNGNVHTEGEIQMVARDDIMPYFMDAGRFTVVKTGAGSPWTYTCTPNATAVPTKTMSITIVRNGIVFGYVGCVMGSFTLTQDNGVLMFNPTILGRDEAVQSLPTATWPVTVPFGPGMYDLEIPTATQVFDADQFEITWDDNASPNYRLKNTGRGAQFINFGERNVTAKTARDFDTRTDYDAFKALTAQSITFKAQNTASHIITVALTSSIKDTYEVANGSQGDVVMSQIQYQCTRDGTGVPGSIVITTTETFTP